MWNLPVGDGRRFAASVPRRPGLSSRGHRVLVPGLVVTALCAAAPLSGQADQQDTTRFAARNLLMKAPLLRDTVTVAEESAYLEEVLAFFQGIQERDSLVRIRSSRDAVRALEDVLAPDSVSVRLQSDPPGFPVRFYRISDGASATIEVTTDTTLILPAGLYRYGFFNSVTGELREQGRVCLQNCLIRWKF